MAVGVLLLITGVFGSASAPNGHGEAAASSESARAAALLAEFPDADRQSLVVIASGRPAGGPGEASGRPAGPSRLTADELRAFGALAPAIERVTGLPVSTPRISDDGAAAMMLAPVTIDGEDAGSAVAQVRAAIDADAPSSLAVQVTGGPAFAADIASSFDGANVALLAVTIGIVALLLIVTYRSPILWLLPLAVVAVADQAAGALTAAVGSALGLQFDAGIISVLVFGAGTNYALLLISRYREELTRFENHREALSVAWRRSVSTIVASNVTVVVSLAMLAMAVIPGTRGLGVASAVGLLLVVAAVLFALPPLLAMCGRRVFWPRVPAVGVDSRQGRLWHALAARVMRRPWQALTAGVLLLVIMATGLIGTSIGLSQAQKFRVPSESAAGLAVLAQHFPPGEAQPIQIVAAAPRAQAVADRAADVDGVVRAAVVGTTADGSLSHIMVTGDFAPGTAQSIDLVHRVRDAVHAVPGADARVGGAVATEVDARAGNQRDLALIAPLILAVSFVVLVVLLKSLLAPALLLVINVASATAAIGAGAWLSGMIFDQQALDVQVPLLAFLFLVALGIDYTIFLVHRARHEAHQVGTRQGMVRAVTHTGGVITSAGVVLAAVFAALGVLPLVVLGQLGVIVGLGVLVDTLVVRTVLIPAVFGLLGEAIWWPRSAVPGPRGPAAATEGHEQKGARIVDDSDLVRQASRRE